MTNRTASAVDLKLRVCAHASVPVLAGFVITTHSRFD
jgi:hypothetical protein